MCLIKPENYSPVLHALEGTLEAEEGALLGLASGGVKVLQTLELNKLGHQDSADHKGVCTPGNG